MEWKGDSKSIQPLLSRLETADQTGHESEGNEQFETYEDNTDESFGGHMSRSRKMKQKLKMKENFDFEFPERDLFIFAILFNRRHMADMFLHQGIDPIGTSLFGCSLLRALSDKATEEEETSTSLALMSHSETLESFAVNVLDVCYLRSKMNTHLLLCRTLKHLGNMAILVLVDRQKLMDLAEHSACQTKLSSIWKGNVALHTSELRILMTIIFPPLIYFMKFHTTEKSSSSLTNEVEAGSPENQPYLDTNKVNPATDSAVFSPSKKKPKDTTLRSKFQEVRMFCGDGNSISLLEAAYKFYRTPVTKFLNNIIASLIFLALFSYFLLTDINPMENGQRPSVVECIVWVWFLTMIFEEIRQICVSDQRSVKYKFQSWWSSFWNQFDFVMCLGMILSVILRFELMTESHFVYVRIVYSITLVMCYLRFMQYFFAEKNMGPKVIMIRKMLTDLMFFFLILSVFLVSFGVAYHINMFPNSPDSWSILYRVFYYPYFQLQGNIFLEDMQGEDVNDCTRNQTLWMSDPASRCPEKNAINLIFCALYLVLTNILLVNLLIAMFSCTFQNVQNVSTKVWHFYRISLIYEYLDRPSLVPPIIFLNHLWRALRHLLIKKGYMSAEHNAFRVPLSDEVNLRLSLFEKEAMEVYLANSSIREREQLDSRVASTAERLEIVMDDLKRIKEAVQQQEKGLNSAEQMVTPAKNIPLGASTSSIVSQSDVTPRITAHSSSISPGDEIVLQAQLKDLQQQTSQNSLRLMELTTMLEKLLKQKD